MAELESFLKGRKPVTFVDLFAGAGGISEGFLQADANNKYFDFLLASDINKNCEVTHRARYNKQLGLQTQFITEDIMSPDFIPHLVAALKGKQVDVVTGGPSCQSFSLAGRRKRFDKRDNLFDHYLKVIRTLKPKYFVMENVKGILTKDKGRFKVEIMKEMRSIINDNEVPNFIVYVKGMLYKTAPRFLADAIYYKLSMELETDDKNATEFKNLFFENLANQFKLLTRQIEYRVSKSDRNVNTIRHGIEMLRRNDERAAILARITNVKTAANIDNDMFAESINSFMTAFSDDSIIDRIIKAIDMLDILKKAGEKEVEIFKQAVILYTFSLDECFEEITKLAKKDNSAERCAEILSSLRLYNINQMVLLSANYGVPQNRERVVYIGSRNDQKEIKEIPATVGKDERVTVYEAIGDLDFIGNGQTKTEYPTSTVGNPKYEHLVELRDVDGAVDNEHGKTYAEWSRQGRLLERFKPECPAFYVRNMEELDNPLKWQHLGLFNHQTSAQNSKVRRRLEIIAKFGGYTDDCKTELKNEGVDSAKRNYFVTKPDAQSPTVCTMPDDFIHYSAFRAMTVREMARLQSFDDSFVFQGKRQTGGDKRKSEIPQYTLVGNAVPPLMSRAIGNEILKNIE